jgi:hypothetical protein
MSPQITSVESSKRPRLSVDTTDIATKRPRSAGLVGQLSPVSSLPSTSPEPSPIDRFANNDIHGIPGVTAPPTSLPAPSEEQDLVASLAASSIGPEWRRSEERGWLLDGETKAALEGPKYPGEHPCFNPLSCMLILSCSPPKGTTRTTGG